MDIAAGLGQLFFRARTPAQDELALDAFEEARRLLVEAI
jgi:hypothetical protein